jgi:hypothetical protein
MFPFSLIWDIGIKMRSRYNKLAEYLKSLTVERVELRFDEVEKILGFTLPSSALRSQWWGNDLTHTQARNGWLCVGWMVERVDLEVGRVTLSRRCMAAEPKAVEFKSRVEFEGYARSMISRALGVKLVPDTRVGHLVYDYIADNIVCEVMFSGEPRASDLTLARITHKLWLLEKADAKRKLLIFGGNKDIPLEWLRRFGSLAREGVEFYYVNGNVERLR